MRLSIIVPVYNVEPYLEKCLDSLLDQNIDKSQYEILVLNDGSTDKSLEIVHKYADKYSNIQEFSHPNKGLSGTRNVGLKNATGDYVWFVDSDDWIRLSCVFAEIRSSCRDHRLCFPKFLPFKEGNSFFKGTN